MLCIQRDLFYFLFFNRSMCIIIIIIEKSFYRHLLLHLYILSACVFFKEPKTIKDIGIRCAHFEQCVWLFAQCSCCVVLQFILLPDSVHLSEAAFCKLLLFFSFLHRKSRLNISKIANTWFASLQLNCFTRWFLVKKISSFSKFLECN